MKKKESNIVPYLMILFALLGIVIAFYDSYSIYKGRLLWCPPPINGCNTVAYSPHARIFNIPMGYLGCIFYLTMFYFTLLLAYDPHSKGLKLGTFLLAVLGVFLSICFMYVELTFIHAFCIYCLISFILTVLLLIYAILHLRATLTHYKT